MKCEQTLYSPQTFARHRHSCGNIEPRGTKLFGGVGLPERYDMSPKWMIEQQLYFGAKREPTEMMPLAAQPRGAMHATMLER